MVFGLTSVYAVKRHQMLMACSPAEGSAEPLSETLKKAAKRAAGGGVAGAVAMFANVATLMWMRTTVNFQYRYGMSTGEALKHLYADGGVRRFYRGVGPALFQGPLSRFGDTAANAGMISLWDSLEATKGLPTWAKTMSASAAAAGFRVFLMPIDACKTILQVEGKDGLTKLRAKMKTGGPFVLYHGAAGAMTATFVGHYPWFYTYNYLNGVLPKYDRKKDLPAYLARNALLGFCSSAVSDTVSNSVRVIKTTTQTSTVPIGYMQALKMVIEKDGVSGLLFRGLVTKIISNGCQGLLFSVLWRLGQDAIDAHNKKSEQKEAVPPPPAPFDLLVPPTAALLLPPTSSLLPPTPNLPPPPSSLLPPPSSSFPPLPPPSSLP
eukprot:CAMPEP_0183358016 /NCGR_PEP_ID=MMETSP0164_2-20130417/47983_1 /TAXON_ID=221442 /ORGANISM="Coccolithus pelagicus ssp braarudi, Strain PLY182g" /LENGTH=378 /DNA_ID=CAMNT_0025531809 /DNA_START=75 /DNA_END=1208 /DNA_ORIENTATION=+